MNSFKQSQKRNKTLCRVLFAAFFAIAAQLMFLSKAQAGLYVDPYIGYGWIGLEDDNDDGSDETQGGVFAGGRLGYKFTLFSAGVDFNSGSTEDMTRTNTGIFFGVDLPILFRFYGTYLLSSDLDFDGINPSLDFKDGYTLGAGTTILPFISLNLEYTKVAYEYSLLGADFDVDTDSYLVSVSLPLDF